jgi:isopentenyl-diphosphate delta-isomerase
MSREPPITRAAAPADPHSLTPSARHSTKARDNHSGEVFEVLDRDGRYLGLMPRAEVHKTGAWHRSAHVFLFDTNGRLWIQRRAASKDLFPNRWDLSVGEHVRAGESFARGAARGLYEELGLPAIELVPLGGTWAYCFDDPERGIHDHELQQSFSAVWSGLPTADGVEVAELARVDASELERWIDRAPDDFTPWFLHELTHRPGLGSFASSGKEPDGR